MAPMKKEAASAGVLDTPFGKFVRLQILTIEDLFAGKKPAMPPEDPAAFKRAGRRQDTARRADLAKLNKNTPAPPRASQLSHLQARTTSDSTSPDPRPTQESHAS